MKRNKHLNVFLTLLLMVSMLSSIAFADVMYTVKKGDVLWKIAKEHNVSTKALAEYNKLKNPNLIYPGDILKIPKKGDNIREENIDNEVVHLTLLHTNDMHGFFKEGKYNGMGAAKVAALLTETKKKNPNTLMIDAGDALQGDNLVTVSDGEAGTAIMNAMGYDVMCAGNHEFDYGWKQTLELAKMLDFPMLAANVTREDGAPFLKAYTMFNLNGVKVGVFGLTTPEVTYKSHPDNTKGLNIGSIYDAAEEAVKNLKAEGADVIVGTVHLGDEGQFTSHSLAEKVSGIDVLIDGHSHSTYSEGKMVNGVLIGAAGEKTKNVGIINLTILKGKIVNKKASLFTKEMSKHYAEQADVLKAVNDAVEVNKPMLEKVVGNAPVVLVGEKQNVRTGETNLGNLIAEALLDISKADVALTNGGGIRASIQKGNITVGDILTVLPFGNTVRVIELKGSDLIAALENGLSAYPEALGAFPHVAGITVTFDATKPTGKRVVTLKVKGEAVDVNKMYTLATNDFLVAGGDNYTMFKDKKVVAEFGAMDEVVIDFINAKGFDKAKIDGRIKALSQTLGFMIQLFAA